jgi:hypothetical protein
MSGKIGNSIARLLFAAAWFVLVLPADARADIIYQVSVDTNSIHNTSGFLDFDFAPGNGSQAALVEINGFSPAGSLNGPPQVSGGVSGTPASMLTIDNSTAFNDYFEGFTYGNAISFLITLGGPAINSPNLTATSGSTFGFGMFDATGVNPLLTSDPNGNAFTIDVRLDGTTSVTGFSPNAQVTLAQPVPEPTSGSLLALVLAATVGALWANRRRGQGKV